MSCCIGSSMWNLNLGRDLEATGIEIAIKTMIIMDERDDGNLE